MNPLYFLFALINKWVPVDRSEMPNMQREAEVWWNKIDLTAPQNHKVWELWLKKYGEDWRFKLLLAVLFVPASHWLREQMDPNKFKDSRNDDLIL